MIEALSNLLIELAKSPSAIGTLLTGIAAVISAVYLWLIRQKRIRASINVIHKYVQMEKKYYSKDKLANVQNIILKYIEKGYQAIFSANLALDHILSWSNPGDLVIDPMCGPATTGKMALVHGRRFKGIDISSEYIDIAAQRLQHAGLRVEVDGT